MDVKYIDHMGSDHTVTQAARISFNKSTEELTDRDKKLITYLADHEHLTPFEHVQLTIEMEVPMYISKQIMRHRSFSFNEVSRRYTEEEIDFYFPDRWRAQSVNNKQASDGLIEDQDHAYRLYIDFLEAAEETYLRLLDLGVAREMARGVLPQNLYTKFWMSGNLRNWVHFCKLRLDPHAQEEVRYVAEEVKKILLLQFPNSAAALFK